LITTSTSKRAVCGNDQLSDCGPAPDPFLPLNSFLAGTAEPARRGFLPETEKFLSG
jgi:hypothetical protein